MVGAPRTLTGNVIGSYAILVLACPIKQVFNRREEEGRRAIGGQENRGISNGVTGKWSYVTVDPTVDNRCCHCGVAKNRRHISTESTRVARSKKSR